MKKLFVILLAALLLCGCAHSQEVNPEEIIDTDYFTLTLPQSWRGATVYQVIPESDRYFIEFYERQDYETDGSGLLCTLKLYKKGEDFTVPGHMLYGVLVTKEADFEVVALIPTEVTYSGANADQYKILSQSINEMVYSLEPKKGCEWLVPQLEAPAESDQDIVIETRYYTLTLPVDFYNNCECQIFPADEDSPDALILYELSSFKAESGGHLCTIELFPHGEDYSYYPSYEWVGVLETPEGDFDIVVIYPTDVQFTGETAAKYNEMCQFIDDLIFSIKPKDGIGMMIP